MDMIDYWDLAKAKLGDDAFVEKVEFYKTGVGPSHTVWAEEQNTFKIGILNRELAGEIEWLTEDKNFNEALDLAVYMKSIYDQVEENEH